MRGYSLHNVLLNQVDLKCGDIPLQNEHCHGINFSTTHEAENSNIRLCLNSLSVSYFICGSFNIVSLAKVTRTSTMGPKLCKEYEAPEKMPREGFGLDSGWDAVTPNREHHINYQLFVLKIECLLVLMSRNVVSANNSIVFILISFDF